MPLMLMFALGATVCAAGSSVLKHRSANVTPTAWAARLPRILAGMVGNPLFALAMVVDVGAVACQVLALRFGDLTVVQPILTVSLVFALLFNHAWARTRVTVREVGLSVLLVAGLLTFLLTSGAVAPQGEIAVGERVPSIVLAVLGVVVLTGAFALAAKAPASVGARAMAVAVAAAYATTAALMKSTTRIYTLRGVGSLLLAWQLWVLIAVAALGLVLNQHAFSMAPLAVSLPVTASLDPLFSVVIGMGVYDEQLRSTPAAVVGEVIGLGALLVGVALLSRADAEVAPD